jgi:hypothetical protein
MGTCGPTAPSAAGRVSEPVGSRPISSLSRIWCMSAFPWAWAVGLSRFRFPALPLLPFHFAFRLGRPSLSDC